LQTFVVNLDRSSCIELLELLILQITVPETIAPTTTPAKKTRNGNLNPSAVKLSGSSGYSSKFGLNIRASRLRLFALMSIVLIKCGCC
jgi:hypothetical protein